MSHSNIRRRGGGRRLGAPVRSHTADARHVSGATSAAVSVLPESPAAVHPTAAGLSGEALSARLR